ncbi:DoxX family protein [Kordiimonas gwangyangensis]|uniref:DoxX family protein n=1 Tax=Kordiimonas gwangyangensis TaxID=288022 RepID=UPI0003774E99|nr:DoxX family protein [Kordiimonas gwangyangensis]
MKELQGRLNALLIRAATMFAMRDYMLLWLRLWVANIFYASGRTKVADGFLTPSDSALTLFEYEYDLPLLPPELAATLAVYAETFLPLLLMLGLLSRLSGLGLVGMTLVIQIFVYPTHFTEHAAWLAALLPVVMLGGGKISLDHLLFRSREPK